MWAQATMDSTAQVLLHMRMATKVVLSTPLAWLISIVKRYPRMYKLEDFNIDIVEIYEYNKVVFGCTFDEFTSNVRNNGIKVHVDLNKIYE